MNIFADIEVKLKTWWEDVSPSVQTFLQKLETDGGKLLMTEAEAFASDLISGGLTTSSFVAAAKDIGLKLLSQGITVIEQDIFAALNIAVGSTLAAAPPVVTPVVTVVSPVDPTPPLAA